ncbi:MAG: nucleotidyltransferase domain-containing protein, partial [Opitutaceae bacterium]
MSPVASPGPLNCPARVAPEAIQIASRLQRSLRPEAVYLFGSHARGDATFDSDFDFLVVVGDSPSTRYERNVAARGLVSDIRVP